MIKRAIILALVTILTMKTIWADVWVKTERNTKPVIITEQVFNEKADGKELVKVTPKFGPYEPTAERFKINNKLYWHFYEITEKDYWEMIKYGR